MLIESSFGRPPWENIRFQLWLETENKVLPNAGSFYSIRNEKGEIFNEGSLWWIAHKWRIWTGKDMSGV